MFCLSYVLLGLLLSCFIFLCTLISSSPSSFKLTRWTHYYHCNFTQISSIVLEVVIVCRLWLCHTKVILGLSLLMQPGGCVFHLFLSFPFILIISMTIYRFVYSFHYVTSLSLSLSTTACLAMWTTPRATFFFQKISILRAGIVYGE